MPDILIGISLLLLFVTMEGMIGWPQGRGVTTITIAHVTFSLAFVAVVVQSRLHAMDRSVEEAALDLGARPALISGWLLAFTMSLDDLVIASFVAGPGSSTLPMVIFSKVRLGVSPVVNALATIIVLVVTVGVIAAGIIASRAEKRRLQDMQMAAAQA